LIGYLFGNILMGFLPVLRLSSHRLSLPSPTYITLFASLCGEGKYGREK
tara:strand:- start:203 stop:349 length:147 start_codon:yes stop_codon:yes gene_type:complete